MSLGSALTGTGGGRGGFNWGNLLFPIFLIENCASTLLIRLTRSSGRAPYDAEMAVLAQEVGKALLSL